MNVLGLLPGPRQLHRIFVLQMAAYQCIEIFRYAAVSPNAEQAVDSPILDAPTSQTAAERWAVCNQLSTNPHSPGEMQLELTSERSLCGGVGLQQLRRRHVIQVHSPQTLKS